MKGSKANHKANVADRAPLMTTTTITVSDLKQNSNLWYKIKILLYDLRNLKSDRESEKRLESTTDELYISRPYFTSEEAALIKGTFVNDFSIFLQRTDAENPQGRKEMEEVSGIKTIEEALKDCLAGFFDKRKASGDSRPCGPHDMAPLYESVFGIERTELKGEKFLGRLRSSRLS